MNMRQLVIAVLLSSLAAAQPAPQVAAQDRDAEAGYQLVQRKQFASGAKRLLAASTRDPENMQLRMDLAYAYQAAKKYADAEEQFQIVASKPGRFQAAAQTAAGEAARLQAEDGPEAAKRRALFAKGYAAVERGDKAEARRVFSALLARDPKDETARKQMGYINLEDGRFVEAVADFEAVRVLQPNDHATALQLGYTYELMKKPEQARSSFTAALESGDEKIREAAKNALGKP